MFDLLCKVHDKTVRCLKVKVDKHLTAQMASHMGSWMFFIIIIIN